LKTQRIVGFLFALTTAALGQEVVQPWQVPCKNEIVRANLELKMQKHIFGELKDQTGAAFVQSKVTLRKQGGKNEFKDYRSVETDKEGKFDLKLVDGGTYRFLPAPNRGFKQPSEVKCTDSVECEIKLSLEVSPSDQEFGGCPVR
jgi:hypothetical protein